LNIPYLKKHWGDREPHLGGEPRDAEKPEDDVADPPQPFVELIHRGISVTLR